MSINFKNIAKRETVISDIMENRAKVDKTDGRIHIEDFDIVSNGKGEAYAVCAINGSQFINGGFVLTKIFAAIIDECGGDKDFAREQFRSSGGLDVQLTRKKTKAGRDITTVEVL